MRPLPLTSPLYGVIWLIAFLIWFGSETAGIVVEGVSMLNRQRRGDTTAPVARDRGSAVVFAAAHGMGIWGAWAVALALPAATIRWQRPLLFAVGVTLALVGVALRWYAIRALGRYFTRQVAITPGQVVVTSGPYRYVRHPSYSALLITMLGLSLTLTNWVSLIVLPLCAFLGIAYRVAVEERALREALGQPYRAYMAHTRRFIPFLF